MAAARQDDRPVARRRRRSLGVVLIFVLASCRPGADVASTRAPATSGCPQGKLSSVFAVTSDANFVTHLARLSSCPLRPFGEVLEGISAVTRFGAVTAVTDARGRRDRVYFLRGDKGVALPSDRFLGTYTPIFATNGDLIVTSLESNGELALRRLARKGGYSRWSVLFRSRETLGYPAVGNSEILVPIVKTSDVGTRLAAVDSNGTVKIEHIPVSNVRQLMYLRGQSFLLLSYTGQANPLTTIYDFGSGQPTPFRPDMRPLCVLADGDVLAVSNQDKLVRLSGTAYATAAPVPTSGVVGIVQASCA